MASVEATRVLALVLAMSTGLSAMHELSGFRLDDDLDDVGVQTAETAEQAEVDLSDQIGDDWGDAALDETQRLEAHHMASKNRRLQATIAQLEKSNALVKLRLHRASRNAAEAKGFGTRIEQQIHSLLRMQGQGGQFHSTDRQQRLGDANEASVRTREMPPHSQHATVSPSSESHDNILAQLAALGVQKSNHTLGEDLLNEAINVGKGDVLPYATAGVFCTQMVDDGRLKPTDCHRGSKLTCNSYFQFCQFEKTDGVDEQVVPEISCAAGGVYACEKAREKLGAERWLAQKKEKQAALMKKAMNAAWMQARYQDRKRDEASARAQKTANDAVKSAMEQGENLVRMASLKGNAPLPDPKTDKLIVQFKTEMREMKYELIDKEKIFLGLKQVSPSCNDAFNKCGQTCKKRDPVGLASEAVDAVMGKVTKCQLECKNKVVMCVMNFVAATYKNVTVEAMDAGQPQ